MAILCLVRHGESEWNAKGLWTGWTDIGLSDKGFEEAKKAGELLKECSELVTPCGDPPRFLVRYREERTGETLYLLLQQCVDFDF